MLSIGYRRRRALVAGWETPLVSAVLLLGGVLVVLLFLWLVARWTGLL